MDAALIAIAVAPLLAVPLFALLLLRPRYALAAGPLLALLANTKFRDRDKFATLSGVIDAQVAYELALYGLLLLIALRCLLLLRPAAFRPPPLGLLLAGYVGLALLSVLWSPNAQLSFVRASQVAILFTYVLVAVPVLGPQRLLVAFGVSLTWYVLVCSTLASLFPFADGTRVLLGGFVRRFSWFKVHPIAAGGFAGCAALFILAWSLFSPQRKFWWTLRLPVWVYLVPLLTVLLQTRSRGPLLAFMFGALLLGIRKYALGQRALLTSDRILLAFLGLGLVMGTMVVTGRGQYRLRYIFLRGQTPDEFLSLSGRTSLWDAAFEFIAERPVFGQGFSAARESLLRVVAWGGHTHNGLLESLFSLGVAGTACLWIPALILLGSSYLRLLKTPPASACGLAFTASGMAFLLLSAVSDIGFGGPATPDVLLLFILVFAHAAFTDVARRTAAAPRPLPMPALPAHA